MRDFGSKLSFLDSSLRRVGASLPQIAFFVIVASFFYCDTDGLFAQESYPVPPEAERQEGVPEGVVHGPYDFESKVFPGTQRKYWVYVPDQYVADSAACVLVVQDGLNRAKDWGLPVICDNLIHANEMPVTIGIYVEPGVVPATRENSQPRFNRSFEYDSLGDRYARFLMEEILPEVAKTYNLSDDPNDRALAGASSGGICAFNAAWERPDQFRRVLSTIGTFVGLRGANQLAALVRKTEPKPLRIFLQDGSSDLNIYAGDWWVANQAMLSALKWSGYDVKHVWGEGGHNGKHAAAIMPDALRWLWRDYPEPIRAALTSGQERRVDLLVEGAGWEQVSAGHGSAKAPTSNAEGEVFFCDPKVNRIFRIGPDGKTRIFVDQVTGISCLSFGPDEWLYGIKDNQEIIRWDRAGKSQTVVDGVGANGLVTMADGFYFSDPAKPAIQWSDFAGNKRVALSLRTPMIALAPTPDHAFMHLVGEGQMTLHARISSDGTLEHPQEYGYLEMPYVESKSGTSGVVVDQLGRVFVATSEGVQILDQLGRVNFIITTPPGEVVSGICFGGALRDMLYITTSSSVYRRKLNTQGAISFGSSVEPPRPRL